MALHCFVFCCRNLAVKNFSTSESPGNDSLAKEAEDSWYESDVQTDCSLLLGFIRSEFEIVDCISS